MTNISELLFSALTDLTQCVDLSRVHRPPVIFNNKPVLGEVYFNGRAGFDVVSVLQELDEDLGFVIEVVQYTVVIGFNTIFCSLVCIFDNVFLIFMDLPNNVTSCLN